MPKKFKVVSMFAGAGGLDLGLECTGRFETVFANELLEAPARTFAENFKIRHVKLPPLTAERMTPSAGDLPCIVEGSIDRLDLKGLAPIEPDIVVGGPPCQDFSVVRGTPRERRGIAVVRGRLYAYFVKALKVLQPAAFIFENVPGLRSANKGVAYRTILDDFQHLNVRWHEVRDIVGNNEEGDEVQGYEVLFEGKVQMSSLGVPQSRERIIVIGVRRDLVSDRDRTRTKLMLANALAGRHRFVSTYPLTAIEAFEGRPLPDLQVAYRKVIEEYRGVWMEVGSSMANEWKANIWDNLSFDIEQDYLLANRLNVSNEKLRVALDVAFDEHSDLLRELEFAGTSVSSLSADPHNVVPKESAEVSKRVMMIPPGENHEFVRGTRWEVEGRGISLIYRRLHPLKPSYTIVAYGGGGTWGYHYERSRGKLTNRERARLQTFPDSFKFEGSSSQVRAMIGEAVPPLAAKRVGLALAEILDRLTIRRPVAKVV
jgi:DNA (cytosine-5)-methyltransferase 1